MEAMKLNCQLLHFTLGIFIYLTKPEIEVYILPHVPLTSDLSTYPEFRRCVDPA